MDEYQILDRLGDAFSATIIEMEKELKRNLTYTEVIAGIHIAMRVTPEYEVSS
jgi:hypothetical protein